MKMFYDMGNSGGEGGAHNPPTSSQTFCWRLFPELELRRNMCVLTFLLNLLLITVRSKKKAAVRVGLIFFLNVRI